MLRKWKWCSENNKQNPKTHTKNEWACLLTFLHDQRINKNIATTSV